MRVFLGFLVLCLGASETTATAIIASATVDGVSVVADTRAVSVQADTEALKHERKIVVLRNRVAVASAGAGSFVVESSSHRHPDLAYDFHRWIAAVDGTIPADAEFTPARFSERLRVAAEASFGPLGRLIGPERDIPKLTFTIICYDGDLPVIHEITVTGRPAPARGVEATHTRYAPLLQPLRPVIRAEGVTENISSGPAAQEARRRAHLSSRSLAEIERLTYFAGLLISIEARTNPRVSLPLDQVIIRPTGVTVGRWRPKR